MSRAILGYSAVCGEKGRSANISSYRSPLAVCELSLTLMIVPVILGHVQKLSFLAALQHRLAMTSTEPQIQLSPPSRLSFGAVLVISGYGFLLVIPVLLSVLLVSFLRLGTLTFIVPVLAVGLTIYFLPLGFGNPYVKKLVHSLQPGPSPGQTSFIAQITFNPRMRAGLRALLEDADDVGWLTLTDSELLFRGDSVVLSVPFARIDAITSESIGYRGLFVYGRSTVISVPDLPDFNSFKLAERSSWVLSDARKDAKKLHDVLAARLLTLRT